jgi:hypothetical protein
LLIVPSEAVFHGSEMLMLGDGRRGVGAVEVGIDGFAIRAHVGVIHVAEDANDALAIGNERVAEFELHV